MFCYKKFNDYNIIIQNCHNNSHLELVLIIQYIIHKTINITNSHPKKVAFKLIQQKVSYKMVKTTTLIVLICILQT